MTNWERLFLRAAANLVMLQEPILAHFHEMVGLSAYDHWIRRNPSSSVGQTPYLEPWHYFFHGLEVDVRHDDGRHLRIELGPGGMTNVFTGWSLAVHVLDSKPPWPVYDELRTYFRAHDVHRRVSEIEEMFLAKGMFARATPELFALLQTHNSKLPDGQARIELPADPDLAVCDRLVLTAEGRREAEG